MPEKHDKTSSNEIKQSKEHHENTQYLMVLAWIGVIIAFSAAGTCLHRGFKAVNIKSPQLTTDLNSTIAEIKRLDSEYTSAINQKSEFKDTWCLIAIIAAALGTVAVTLRAPQYFVILPGAFVGIVYGVIEFQSPQTTITSIAKARTCLSCLESAIIEISLSNAENLAEVEVLVHKLKDKCDKVKTYSNSLTTYHRRLANILQARSDIDNKAMAAIDKALLTSVENYDNIIDILKEHLNTIKRLQYSPQMLSDDKVDKITMKQRLDSIRTRIDTTIAKLSIPEKLQGELRSGLNEYLEQAIESNDILEKADDHLKQTKALLPRLEPTIVELEDWPRQIESINVTANKAVAEIHNALCLEISQTGSFETFKGVMMKMPRTFQKGPSETFLIPQSSARRVSMSQAMEVPFKDHPNLSKEIGALDEAVKQSLRKFAHEIRDANDKSKYFQNVKATALATLLKAKIILLNSSKIVEALMKEKGGDLSETVSTLQKSEQILRSVNFTELKSKIESCPSAMRKK